jgi:membrane protein
MGAAIAYNSLFALVPLALAFVAILSFFGQSATVIDSMVEIIERNLPTDLAMFFTDIIEESVDWVGSQREAILVVSLLVALWSGSRAVYAVQKALRAVEAKVDARGYIRSRLLGLVVTIGAAVGILVAYTFLTLGSRIWSNVAEDVGTSASTGTQVLLYVVAAVWVWILLWAIYRWGPPEPIRFSGVVSALVAALLVAGTAIAFSFVPSISGAAAAFGAIGILLIWLYYVGIVVVAAPTVFAAVIDALSEPGARTEG